MTTTTTHDSFKKSYFKNILLRIPFVSVMMNGWQIAARAYADDYKHYCKKQQRKTMLYVFLNPRFASRWFKSFQSPDFLLVAKNRQRLYMKPFRVYMSTQWSKKQKVKVIRDTYRFILSRGEAFTQVIAHKEGIKIARFDINDSTEGVLTLGYDERYRKEGELVLSFECEELGGVMVSAAFSFEETEEGRWVGRIGCVQGHNKNALNSLKIAQKLMHGLRPKSFLLFAAQEFSRQLGLSAIYGVGDTIQAYRRKHLVHLSSIHAIQFDYNEFWSELGGTPGIDGWYELPLIPHRKNIQEIKSEKRSLYNKRYRLLDDVSLKIADAVKGL